MSAPRTISSGSGNAASAGAGQPRDVSSGIFARGVNFFDSAGADGKLNRLA